MGKHLEQFEEVAFEDIDEGRFLADCTESLRRAARALCDHVRKHEGASKGAKATLAVNVTLIAQDNLALPFYMVAGQSITLPKAPPVITSAIALGAEEDTDQLSLFCRPTGSTGGNPRQARLCTEDGRPIDQETGQAKQAEPVAADEAEEGGDDT